MKTKTLSSLIYFPPDYTVPNLKYFYCKKSWIQMLLTPIYNAFKMVGRP